MEALSLVALAFAYSEKSLTVVVVCYIHWHPGEYPTFKLMEGKNHTTSVGLLLLLPTFAFAVLWAISVDFVP